MVLFVKFVPLWVGSIHRARIDRSGQVNPVIFHHVRAMDTVDDLLAAALDRKEQNQSNLLQMVKDYVNAKSNNS